MNGNKLDPVKMLAHMEIAPKEVMNIVSCGCKTGCTTLACTCKKHDLSCSIFCKCKGQLFCENPFTAVINQTSDDYTDLSNDADNDGYSSAAEY